MPPRINLPPISRAILAILLCLSGLNVSLRFHKWRASLSYTPPPGQISNYLSSPKWAIPYLVLVPAYSLRYPWTFLTAALVENNFISLAVSGVVVWFGGRYLERAWGGKEFAKFMVLVAVIPNALAFAVYVLWHGVTKTPEFPTPIQGLVAVEAGFLVALKQLVPEHTVSLFSGLLRIRVKHFPAIFTLTNILSGPLLGTDTAFWLSLFGFLTSWIHLRFFRMTEITSAATGASTMMQGDASDTFAFPAFFPDVMQPFLTPVCDAAYDLLVQLRLCTPFSAEAVAEGNENAVSRSETLPGFVGGGRGGGGRRAEAERRRALALKALDQRLSAGAGAGAARPAPAAATAAPVAAPVESVGAAASAGAESAPVEGVVAGEPGSQASQL